MQNTMYAVRENGEGNVFELITNEEFEVDVEALGDSIGDIYVGQRYNEYYEVDEEGVLYVVKTAAYWMGSNIYVFTSCFNELQFG
jgi:hypothetical protein